MEIDAKGNVAVRAEDAGTYRDSRLPLAERLRLFIVTLRWKEEKALLIETLDRLEGLETEVQMATQLRNDLRARITLQAQEIHHLTETLGNRKAVMHE